VVATDKLATAIRIDQLKSGVDGASAAIGTESITRAEGDSALGKRIDTTQAKVDENSATIQIVDKALADANKAIASQTTTIEAVAGARRDGTDEGELASALASWEARASVQVTARAQAATDGKLSTMWAVKMQVNSNGQYVAAGIGLGIEQNADGLLQSQFLVSADRFAIVNTIAGGAISTPFVVQGGQVFMSSAFIQDGSITNAKIGNYIQSNNYVAGVSGWKLFFDGTFEINSALGGQARQVINNYGGKVYDENGIKRYQWGDLSA
jgi:predicted phage tail protein